MAEAFPLAFPYFTDETEKVALTCLVFWDDEDTSRIILNIENKQCNRIKHTETYSTSPIDRPLRYISNPLLLLLLSPLLLCIPSSHYRIKLHMDVSRLDPGANKENELLIVKSSGSEDISTLRTLLLMDDWPSTLREVSKISFEELVPSQELNIVIVNDSIPRCFPSNIVEVSIWEKRGDEFCFSFKFDVWVDSVVDQLRASPPISSEKDDLAAERKEKYFSVKELRQAFNFDLQDGPEFRKVLSRYEQDVPRLKRALLGLSEETKNFNGTLGQLMVHHKRIIDFVGIILDSQFNPLLQKLHVHASFAANFAQVFNAFQSNCSFILDEVFNHALITKTISYCNVPLVEAGHESLSKKKIFEKQSKEYYDWLNKYLSNEKDRPQLKLLLKRKTFELSKFDYLNSLNLVSNNQYFNQFLELVMKFCNLPESNGFFHFSLFMDSRESQNLLSRKSRLYLDTLLRFNSEKLQLRQMIEACQTNEELTNLLRDNPILFSYKSKSTGPPKIDTNTLDPSLVFPLSPVAATLLSVVSHDADQNPNLSGILYTLGGQGKPGWHKEWVVLRNGQLMEFSDWRNGTSPINKPIDVAIASVKPVNHDKRHHCFEIISSCGHKHVFQALNNDERTQWIKALYNAGQITNSLISRAKKKPLIDQAIFSKPVALSVAHESGSPVSIFSCSFSENDSFLAAVRAVFESGNDICADCGSLESVEWISLNSLVAICVQCSSCHRNMGLHISKVKSLKLDNFKDEQRILLSYISNNGVNRYLEETVALKITPQASDEERLRYIKHKYEQKTFLSPTGDLSSALVRLVRRIDVAGVVKSLNCGADPNLNIQISKPMGTEPKTISLFEYLLKKKVEVDERGGKRDFYVVSELLLLNNCKIPTPQKLKPDLGLSKNAMTFWTEKAAVYGSIP